MFDENKHLDAQLPPSINRITGMWVYSDIIELSAVGDTQAPILGYLLIQSKFDEMGYWNFNSPYNIEIKEHFVSNITIKIGTEPGEDFSIVDRKITCYLHVLHRPFLV